MPSGGQMLLSSSPVRDQTFQKKTEITEKEGYHVWAIILRGSLLDSQCDIQTLS